jgi:hypothetical protein
MVSVMDDRNTVGLVRVLHDLAVGKHEHHRTEFGPLPLQSRDFIASKNHSPRNRSDLPFPILEASSIHSELFSGFKLIEAVLFSPLF